MILITFTPFYGLLIMNILIIIRYKKMELPKDFIGEEDLRIQQTCRIY